MGNHRCLKCSYFNALLYQSDSDATKMILKQPIITCSDDAFPNGLSATIVIQMFSFAWDFLRIWVIKIINITIYDIRRIPFSSRPTGCKIPRIVVNAILFICLHNAGRLRKEKREVQATKRLIIEQQNAADEEKKPRKGFFSWFRKDEQLNGQRVKNQK